MFKMYKRFFDYSKNYIVEWKQSFILEIIRCIVEAIQFIALVIALKAILGGEASVTWAAIAFGIMLVSVIGTSILWKYAHGKQAVASYRTCGEKRIEIGERMKYMPMGFFKQKGLGKITAVATTTMEDLQAISFAIIVRSVVGIIHATVLSLAIFIFEWRIGIIYLIGIGIFLIINNRLLDKSKEVLPIRFAAQGKLVDATLEYIQGMGIVKSFNLTKNANSTMETTISETERQNLIVEKLRIPYIALEQIVLYLISLGAAFAAIMLYLNGSLDLLVCLFMIISSFMVFNQLEIAGMIFFLLPAMDASIDRVEEISHSPIMDIDGVNIKPENLNIEFKNVNFSYSGRKVINNVSLKIPEGSRTAIVGPSGGGKTTLCNLIARFWDVDSGEVTLGNRDVKEYSLDCLLSHFSIVFQNVYLFNDTIENNIKFGNPSATHEEVVIAAKKACCHDFIEALPEGYSSLVGEGGATISGGEKQRISIARAILKNASIIILDEATANVDPENENQLQQALLELTEGKTVIMIAHRLKTVRNADQIIVLANGEIVQSGTHDKLIKEKGIYQDFVGGREKAAGWRINV